MNDYLQLVRGKYRVRVKVGQWPLQRILGKETLTKALRTADRDKAERLAGPHILEFKRQIVAAELKQLRRLTAADAFKRAPRDHVRTNPELARRIIEHFQPTGKIVDPCRGNGAFFDHLPPGSDWCEVTEGRDFLAYTERVDWVISNPRWSAKVYRSLARHAFEISANVVFLVRLNTAIGTTARERDYLDRGHALKEIIPISWQMAGFPQEGFTLAVCHWQRGSDPCAKLPLPATLPGSMADSVDTAVEARPGAQRPDPKDPGGGRVCAKWRQHAAVALPRRKRSEDQGDGRGLIQARVGRASCARYRAGEPAAGMSRERFLRVLDAAEYLANHIHEAPVWIVPCLEGATPTRTSGSSIYPAVQTMLLAARALGLGATLTTLYLQFEKEADAAMGLPPNVHSYALLPIGYPMGRFGPVRRVPLTDVVFEDRWGQPSGDP